MTRISSYGQSQLLIQAMLRNNELLAKSQVRVATGKQAQSYAELGRDVSALLGARNTGERLDAWMTGNRQVEQKLELYNTTLGEIATVAEDLRQDMIQAVNLNSPVGFVEKLESNVSRLASLLKTTYNGRYIFAGSRTDTPAVSIDSAADLLALADPYDAFQNDTLKTTANIDENQQMTYGMLADEIAGPLLELMHRIGQYNSGTLPTGAAGAPAGAFTDPLTTNQRDFLIGEFNRAQQALATTRNSEAENGVRLARVDKIITRQSDDLVFVKRFIADIEDADIAEAISQLQADQTALTAAQSVVARIADNTLLNFI
ncbi:MAG: flagellin [Alphaproteobacteria bacterium]